MFNMEKQMDYRRKSSFKLVLFETAYWNVNYNVISLVLTKHNNTYTQGNI